MKITKIEIENILSFSEKQTLEAKDFNLLIGPNNEGKSNIFKITKFFQIFLNFCTDNPSNHSDLLKRKIDLNLNKKDNKKDGELKKDSQNENIFFREKEDLFFNQENTNKINFCFGLKFNQQEIDQIFSKLEPHNYKDSQGIIVKNYIEFLFSRSEEKEIEIYASIFHENSQFYLSIQKIIFPKADSSYQTFFDSEKEQAVFLKTTPFGNQYQPAAQFYNNSVEHSVFKDHFQQFSIVLYSFLSELKEILKKNIHYIDNIRILNDSSYDEQDNIVSNLMRLRDGMQRDRQKFKRIKDFITKIALQRIGISELELIFPRYDDKKHVLKLNFRDKNNEKILPLSQLGSGIEQIIYLVTEILSYTNKSVFFIEEPESHFHPKLQRDFIRFLQEDLNKGNQDFQFFITTHSPVFIDQFLQDRDHSQIYKIGFKEESNNSIISKENISDIFYTLGSKGSDLLQSNGIIWVEGPSDRIYINKWIEIYNELIPGLKLEEGREYSILYYGGSILSHFSLEESDTQESDQEANNERNNFIELLRINRNAAVLMDCDTKKGEKWETKKRIETELKNKSGFSWITDGKEIENYFSKEVIEMTYPNKLTQEYTTNSEIPFANFFKDTDNPKQKTFYERNKVKFASDIEKNMKKTELEENPLLKEQIKNLIDKIKYWNHLE